MVSHPKQVREQFEPQATRLITSLRFPHQFEGITTTAEGLPLPPGYTPADPLTILNDIGDPRAWRAFTGGAGTGALQSFYLREISLHQWDLEEYLPFPGASDLGFARFKLRRGTLQITLGIMPSNDQAAVVYKISNL
jgi:hypothetical protein